MVLAGPGSGKTRVLTHRVAYLLDTAAVAWPNRVLALTFTRKAAAEMTGRITQLLGSRREELWVGTFHAFSSSVLRSYGTRIGIDRDFLVADEGYQQILVSEAARRASHALLNANKTLERISRLKCSLINSDKFLEAARQSGKHEDLAETYREYDSVLRENRMLDFDDLILNTVLLLQKEPGVLQIYRDSFPQILVDEYQDTNYARFVLIKTLGSGHRNVFVVADDDQSIYGFQGADPKNITRFITDFDPTIFRLRRNYRSTEVILDAANRLIQRNPMREDKVLVAQTRGGEPIIYYQAENEQSEAEFIASTIQGLRAEGYRYRDFAIFVRSRRRWLSAIEDALSKHSIPYIVIREPRKSQTTRACLDYLRFAVSPNNDFVVSQILKDQLREKGYELAGHLSRTGQYSLWQKISKTVQRPECLTENAWEGTKCLREFLAKLLASPGKPADLLTEAICYRRTYVLPSLTKEEQDIQTLEMENLLQICHLHCRAQRTSLREVVEWATLECDLPVPEGKDCVRVMTVHSAKGLEFAVVFFIAFEEGLLPDYRATQETDMQEERRCCYVGITRARKRLYLTYTKRRMGWVVEPSRFLGELQQRAM